MFAISDRRSTLIEWSSLCHAINSIKLSACPSLRPSRPKLIDINFSHPEKAPSMRCEAMPRISVARQRDFLPLRFEWGFPRAPLILRPSPLGPTRYTLVQVLTFYCAHENRFNALFVCRLDGRGGFAGNVEKFIAALS